MSTHPLYSQLSVKEVDAMRQRNESFMLIDVREPAEYAIARIDGAILHPIEWIVQTGHPPLIKTPPSS
jgi:rhodanese-related sulfurtransferase